MWPSPCPASPAPRPGLSLLLLVLGCGGPPQTLDECAPADCPPQLWARAFALDPGAVRTRLSTAPAPVRLAAVIAISEAHPGDAPDLCDLLPPGDSQTRCTQIHSRPHLRQPTRMRATPSVDRAAPGPADTIFRTPQLPAPAAAEPADPAPCAGVPDPHTCWTRAAEDRLAVDDLGAARSACAAIETEPWRSECAFQAARARVEKHPASAMHLATQMCLDAPRFVDDCMDHIVVLAAEQSPSTEWASDQDWQAMAQTAAGLRSAWAADPAAADRAVHRYWSVALWTAHASSPTLHSGPVLALPAEAQPHLRSAMAARLLGRRPNQSGTLDRWQDQLAEAMARPAPHNPRSRGTARQITSELGRGRLYWHQDSLGDGATPALLYRQNDRRTTSPDPALDAQLAILEAAARLGGPHIPLLKTALSHPEPLLARTAQRLLIALGLPHGQPIPRGPQDPAPSGAPAG